VVDDGEQEWGQLTSVRVKAFGVSPDGQESLLHCVFGGALVSQEPKR
jgi:hypothetical protein